MFRIIRRRPASKGQALVEFALIFPIFVLILFGLFDVGRAVFAYNTLSNAARQGARVAIVNQSETNIDAEAMQHAIGLGVAADDVTVTYTKPDGTSCASPYTIGCFVDVSVSYTYTAATPIIGNLLDPITITASTEMPIERTCPDPPGLTNCN